MRRKVGGGVAVGARTTAIDVTDNGRRSKGEGGERSRAPVRPGQGEDGHRRSSRAMGGREDTGTMGSSG